MAEPADPGPPPPLRGPEPAVFAGAPWRRWVLPAGILLLLALAGIWAWLLTLGLDPTGMAAPALVHRLRLVELVHHARAAVRA